MRNIPACAGKTNNKPEGFQNRQEHPRVRGENGVPPSRFSLFRWNIPACAGKTSQCRRIVCTCWEHPRVRGENTVTWEGVNGIPGTSPRARGKRLGEWHTPIDTGNIPACAGKTNHGRRRKSYNTEHPRVRGENAMSISPKATEKGTSPRARGKQEPCTLTNNYMRNIPACAGKTRLVSIVLGHEAEHPRVRGENRHHQEWQPP